MKLESNENFDSFGLKVRFGAMVFISFMGGLYIGRKLSNTVRRVASLASVGPSKMVLVVREDLKMGKGKIASQCSHATLIAYKRGLQVIPNIVQAWEDLGQPKVVLKAPNMEEIERLIKVAVDEGITTNIVRDAGRTQVNPGSVTVLAVGPGATTSVDRITGHLKLL
ncbi:unnamed protein product [Meganyctiphanes norvegica]|uniref:peptidyl-tRNA hydrolase n=1 Tax=Meganyctiphanes norvegica TaxID=48144 RepID=A0AAV2RKX2_MEGNR